MNFGPKRGHVACIFDNFFKDFGLLLAAILVSIISGDMELLSENLGVLIIVLINPVIRLVGYFTTYYSIDEEKILIQSGLLKKSSLEVPISTITTVDFSQNVFHQIFGVYKLNIDNSSNISNTETKVHMTLKKDEANIVKKLLIKGRDGLDGLNYAGEVSTTQMPSAVEPSTESVPEGRKYIIKNKDILLMGALKAKGIYLLEVTGFFAAALAFIPMPDDAILEKGIDAIIELGIGIFFIMVAIVVFFLSILLGMAGNLIRYYGYKVLDNGEALKIEYGFFDRKTYTLSKKKICGFYYEQSALMRFAKVGILNLMAVGYGTDTGEETSEEAILFPMLPHKELRRMVGELMPEMADEGVYQKAAPKSLRYFFLRFSVFFSLAVLIGCLFLPKTNVFFHHAWLIGAFLLMLALTSSILHYLCEAVYGTTNHFSFVYGGFKKRTVFVKTNMIESIECGGSIWKQKRGIADISVGCIAPLGLSEQGVDNMPVSTYKLLKEYLIY